MSDNADVTRRIVRETKSPIDDIETHKMGANPSYGDQSYTSDTTSFIDDIANRSPVRNFGADDATDHISALNKPAKPYQEDEATRIFRPNAAPKAESAAPVESDHMRDPVVGWVVVVDGPGKGAALALGYGMNTIGRANCRVNLNFGDLDISREPHASITYDPRGRVFYVNHGGGKNLTYLNDAPVLQPAVLNGGEVINLGETALKFVPFCGKEFDWQDGK
ncbi:FHA domain-containing protein [Thiomicrospira microaerophila]|uniref:FHA domain-containing protein n=1 Tax=Thiomicrospira microaerophila TaxID=406020 RepID=UPI0018E06901|nr:FHA domain-containing protein [Thiomicrospira microaerophila]